MHLVIGDLNLPNINGNILFGPDDEINNMVLNFILNYGYSLFVHFPTRNRNLLDILLTDADTLVTSVTAHPPIGYSDHIAIEFSVAVTSNELYITEYCVSSFNSQIPVEQCRFPGCEHLFGEY